MTDTQEPRLASTDALYWGVVDRRMRQGERLGQAVFNEALMRWPEIAERYRGSEIDPFYTNRNIPAFLAAVEASHE